MQLLPRILLITLGYRGNNLCYISRMFFFNGMTQAFIQGLQISGVSATFAGAPRFEFRYISIQDTSKIGGCR